MSYEPTTIKILSNGYQRLDNKGVNCWYGEAGGDIELAKMILDGASIEELVTYCQDYGYLQEDED
jgi:hypothetical protein